MFKEAHATIEHNIKTQRQSNVELLRIISMLIIVANHFAIHGGFDFSNEIISVNRLWVLFLEIGGKIGVNVFVLISGYFLVSAQSIKTSKVIKLWGQIFFYSIIILVIFIATGLKPFSISEVVKNIAPITFEQYWFASTYFVLYLFSPYINKILNHLTKKQYISFLGLTLICWCVIPTFSFRNFESNSLIWFVVLYAIAGYFKLYGINTKLSSNKLIFISFVGVIATYMLILAFYIIGTRISKFSEHATDFYNMQAVPIVVVSVFLFIGFLKIDIKYKKFINVISSATFGVYLIHDNHCVRPFIWEMVFKNATYANNKLLIPYSLLVITGVFVVCVIIELIRIHLIEKNFLPLINKIADYIDTKKDKVFNFLWQRIEKS